MSPRRSGAVDPERILGRASNYLEARSRHGWVIAMQVSKQTVIDVLRKAGYFQVADEAARVLPDPVDLEQVLEFGGRHGISRDELVGRMGGSPF